MMSIPIAVWESTFHCVRVPMFQAAKLLSQPAEAAPAAPIMADVTPPTAQRFAFAVAL